CRWPSGSTRSSSPSCSGGPSRSTPPRPAPRADPTPCSRSCSPGTTGRAPAIPADLRAHIRYPEALFKLQSEVYGLYHMTNPEVFFNREDLWTVATETATDSEGEQGIRPMQPNFVLMKLPGGTSEEFVEILPFTPANRNNLIGWI